ncbi:MAG: hypothetical protein ACYCPW_03895 [Nitrososphaerales archaeon]
MPFAIKSVKQSFSPSVELLDSMRTFRVMVNDSIRVGLETNASSLKKLSCLNYRKLRLRYREIPSYYCLTTISKAAGILSSRKKSIRRGMPTKDPYLRKPLMVSCYGFKIQDGFLSFLVSLKTEKGKVVIPLTKYVLDVINQPDIEVRSFTVTENSLSLCIRKEVPLYAPKSFLGIDRNAVNVTCGNSNQALQFDLGKVEAIAKTTKDIVGSLRRNDVRIRKKVRG